MANLLSPLREFPRITFWRFNILTVDVNVMKSSASLYKFKFQSAVLVVTRESDWKTDNGGYGHLILLRQSVEETGRKFF